MIYKRYQHWSKDGIVWSKWFPYNGERYKYQLKSGGLLNEYRDETEDIPKDILQGC